MSGLDRFPDNAGKGPSFGVLVSPEGYRLPARPRELVHYAEQSIQNEAQNEIEKSARWQSPSLTVEAAGSSNAFGEWPVRAKRPKP
ncbi:MAG: hypothetical protein GXP27_06955 [Planctomycetes bacterium]|nr:hypothetical protein [Planctomycetota bacterium]